jgi:hypothetical protein
MVRDLCLSDEAARPSGAEDCDPRRSPGSIRNSRMQRGSTKLWQIYRAPLAKGPERADAGSRPAGPEVASAQLAPAAPVPQPKTNPIQLDEDAGPVSPIAPGPKANQQPPRFFGSVEIDMVRPVKAFEAILNAHGRLLVLTLRLPG